ncbi:hypothetical protein [Pseudoxanthomonas sp. z9]|uniref:hypothetical protein n=1 Tax=Pseudoxanthomonas sp. z9 TaxID=2584942 RepID=UPI00114446EF|nr:hypothetical protein [Pseudoxanthomonas sp. z9]MCL6711470.1 hypothetical protein [Pseudomonas sp. R2.Fl]
MNAQDILQENTPPIAPELLNFGIGIYQAALNGDLQTEHEVEAGGELAQLGIQALQKEIEGHGLSQEQQISLMFRVLAFTELLEHAVRDERASLDVVQAGGGFEITDRFLDAASKARLIAKEDGTFGYDFENVVKLLLH